MTKQINITHLEDAMIRAKQYVDDQATADVIRTATTLWSGYQIYPTTANTPFSTQMVATNTAYITMYGQTTGGITLSDRLDNYDAIEVGINRVINNNGVSTNYGNTTYTFPVSDIIDTANNRYRLRLFEWYGDVFSTNDKAYAYFGCQDHNKLGVHIVLSGANDNWHVTYVKGIKYAQGGGGGSTYTAGDGIDITNDVISTDDMTEAEMTAVANEVFGSSVVPDTMGYDQIYSTAEQVVGKWVDGKPIYQKTIVSTTAYTNGTHTLVSNFASANSVDKIVDIRATAKASNGSQYNVSDIGDGRGFVAIEGGTNLNFYIAGTSVSWTPTATIQYTKTTDTGGA